MFFCILALSVPAEGIESVEISPNPVGRGDLFTMTIIVDYPASADVEFPLKELPEQLQLWRGPYVRTFIDSARDGDTRRKVRITTTFKARNSGRLIIPELSVFAAGKVFKTEPELLRVGLYKNRKLYIPLEVEWRPAFDNIYAGEAVPLFLVVGEQEVVSLFDRIRVATPRAGFFEKAEGLGEIEQHRRGSVVLYDIPAAAYIYTAPVPGEVKIPSAGVDSGGITGWTDNLFLQIKPVPRQISSTGAIGNFDFLTEISSDNISADEEIVLRSVVSGTGNLNYLKIPEPEVEGCILVSRTEDNDYTISLKGYSGSKSIVWTFNPSESETSEVKIPEFSFLNKESGIIETLPERVYSIKVSSVQSELSESETEKKFTFASVQSDSESGHEWKNYYKSPVNYIWLLPAGIFYLLGRLLKGRRTMVALIVTIIMMVAAVSLLRSFMGPWSADDAGPSAADYYQYAAEKYDEGDLPDSLHSLRTAVYINPMNRLYSATLEQVEDQGGYFSAVSPSVGLHPDLFFYILIAAVNLFFLAVFFKSIKPGGAVSVVYIMFAVGILISSGLLFYSHFSRTSLSGIVGVEDVFIKKIPRESAGNWLPMEPGLSVKILDESGEFMLVETGMGVKGWIEQEMILTDRPQ